MLKCIFAILMMSSWAFAGPGEYRPGQWEIDPLHTRVSFISLHFVVGRVEGRFNDVEGQITLAENFTESKVNASINVKSIDTGVKKRDDHLRSKDFFEVAKYPQMKLVSKKVTGSPEDFTLAVDLTIKDVTKEVPFKGKYLGWAKDSWGQERVAFELSGKVNRRDFNINYNDKVEVGLVVGDEIQINIWSEAVGKKQAEKGPPKK